MRKLLGVLATSATMIAAPEAARAGDVAAAVDVGAVLPTDLGFKPGAGVDGRLGYRWRFGPVWLQPEFDGGYRRIETLNYGRSTGGLRFGLGGLIQPQLCAHVGAGFGDGFGFTADGGGALDVEVSPVFIGAHAGFDILHATSATTIHWIEIGAHAGFLF